ARLQRIRTRQAQAAILATTDGAGTETDTFSLSVTDGTGSSTPASLVIEIIDDHAQLQADVRMLATKRVNTLLSVLRGRAVAWNA
ncbi:hypothetical protein U8L64_19315, partial [Pseudomonas sp. FIP_A4]|uniref:hypothetical protein n=1 Tax=Pseudomonas sp. FIP_A4 TaxID=3070684 RepID=UPI002FD20A1D